VNSKFVKKAVAAGLLLGAVEANATSTIIIGCAAPGNNTTGATVYSIDATDSTGAAVSMNGNVAVGNACSRAINAMVSTTGQTMALVAAGTVTIKNAGYTVQQFTFSSDATNGAKIATGGTVGLVGCAAAPAGTGGATVYSIDALNSTGGNLSTALNAKLNLSCSNAVSTAAAYTNSINTGTIATGSITPLNVTIDNAGYSLQQFLIQ